MANDLPPQTPSEDEIWEALDRYIARLPNAADVDVEAALQRVKARRFEERSSSPWRTKTWRIAAAIVVVLGASIVWKASNTKREGSAIADAQILQTRVGQTDSVYLSDGSLVVLGPESRVQVPAGYGTLTRDVELNGEALFDVRHDDNLRFSVRAGNATIHDIGTSFIVRSSPGEPVAVVVTVGSVLLHETGKPEAAGVVLRAGDRGALGVNGEVMADQGKASSNDLAWTEGRLIFDDASLDHVAKELRRWYGVDLRVTDESLKQRHVTASFKGESVQQVLDVIALTLGARIERNGNHAILHAR